MNIYKRRIALQIGVWEMRRVQHCIVAELLQNRVVFANTVVEKGGSYQLGTPRMVFLPLASNGSELVKRPCVLFNQLKEIAGQRYVAAGTFATLYADLVRRVGLPQ